MTAFPDPPRRARRPRGSRASSVAGVRSALAHRPSGSAASWSTSGRSAPPGDPTASWVEQALPGALEQALARYRARDRSGATLVARIDCLCLGPNRLSPAPEALSQDTIGGTLMIRGPRGASPPTRRSEHRLVSSPRRSTAFAHASANHCRGVTLSRRHSRAGRPASSDSELSKAFTGEAGRQHRGRRAPNAFGDARAEGNARGSAPRLAALRFEPRRRRGALGSGRWPIRPSGSAASWSTLPGTPGSDSDPTAQSDPAGA